jgi:hypothetical protein
MAVQRGTLFPELAKKPDSGDLIGLKITEVVTDLHDTVKFIRCEDANGEVREITFRPVDASYIAVKLDEAEVLNIETEV